MYVYMHACAAYHRLNASSNNAWSLHRFEHHSQRASFNRRHMASATAIIPDMLRLYRLERGRFTCMCTTSLHSSCQKGPPTVANSLNNIVFLSTLLYLVDVFHLCEYWRLLGMCLIKKGMPFACSKCCRWSFNEDLNGHVYFMDSEFWCQNIDFVAVHFHLHSATLINLAIKVFGAWDEIKLFHAKFAIALIRHELFCCTKDQTQQPNIIVWALG